MSPQPDQPKAQDTTPLPPSHSQSGSLNSSPLPPSEIGLTVSPEVENKIAAAQTPTSQPMQVLFSTFGTSGNIGNIDLNEAKQLQREESYHIF